MTREPIGNGLYVFCSDNHKFGTDAVLLADFARPRSATNICDLCAGCGIIPLLICRDVPDIPVTAVELQPNASALLQQAVSCNHLEGRVTPVCADLKTLDPRLHGRFDLVTVNPPYQKAGSGKMSGNDEVDIARFELACTLQDVANTAAKLLVSKGRLCMCYPPARLSEACCILSAAGLEPKRLRMVCKAPDAPPELLLLEAVKAARPGLRILPALFTGTNGNISEELQCIYAPFSKNLEPISKGGPDHG